MEGRTNWRGSAEDVAARVEQWRAAGATHLSVNTMNAGFSDVDHHIAALNSLSGALGLSAA
jgi:hypothetical protein